SAEGIDLFAFEHRTARSTAFERNKAVAIVTRIELAAECGLPSFLQHRSRCADPLNDLKINRTPDFWNRQILLSGQPGDEGTRQFDKIRPVGRDLFEVV